MNESVNRLIKNIKLAKLMLRLIKLPDKKIEPESNPALPSGYRYPVAEEYLGKNIRDELEGMANEGLLEREFFSKELGCPKDGSINLSFKRHCPNCDSINISKKELIEHMACGYIGPESDYKNGKCPKCGRETGKLGVDYIKHGMQYVCQNCNNFFQDPVDKVVCFKDKYSFPIEDAREVEIYAYKITPLLEQEINKAVNQQKYIADKLQELGFKIESPATLKGRSGVAHDFFMVATSGAGFLKTRVLVELLGDGEITKNDVFNLYAKAMDVSAYGVLIGAIPRMTDDAKAIAKSYKIAFVEDDSLPEVSEKMVHKFAELIETPEEKMLEIFGGGLGSKEEVA
jgi:predicted RNA-binding Zn-ribbon protein involved in translation (DUF1610 family)